LAALPLALQPIDITAGESYFSIDKDPLDAWVVAARIIYEYECGINLSERRIQN